MHLKPGERQTDRTKTAITQAFTQLLRQKNYDAFTVNDIVRHANTGRSTFYRHFPSKADVLLSIHEEVFRRFNLGFQEAADWLATQPPPALTLFLTHLQQQYATPGATLLVHLGKDADYLVRRIDELLVQQCEVDLRRSFCETESSIPFAVLARAIAGSYSWIIRWWFVEQPDLSATEIATQLHRVVRALICEAFAQVGVR
jgi:AcrR family transcriptional regulator